jgi:hypothetical protein
LLGAWPLAIRSFPTYKTDPAPPQPLQRDFYWVPLIRDANGDPSNANWQIILFILRRDGLNYYLRDGAATDWANYGDGQDQTATGQWAVPGVVRVAATVDSNNNSKLDIASPPGNTGNRQIFAGNWSPWATPPASTASPRPTP